MAVFCHIRIVEIFELLAYEYDSNGNMTTDDLRSLKLKYNYLNLVSKVTDSANTNDVKATYRWLTDGTKTGVTSYNSTTGDPEGGFESSWAEDALVVDDELRDIQENTMYVYTTKYHSQKDLDKAGIKGTYLGQTHFADGMYYSLHGGEYEANSFLGMHIVQADASIMLAANLGEFVSTTASDFWEKYESLISLGGNMASILDEYAGISGLKSVGRATGVLSAFVTIPNALGKYNAGTLTNFDLIDASMNVVSLFGPYGAAAGIGWEVSKASANVMSQGVVGFKNKFLNDFFGAYGIYNRIILR